MALRNSDNRQGKQNHRDPRHLIQMGDIIRQILSLLRSPSESPIRNTLTKLNLTPEKKYNTVSAMNKHIHYLPFTLPSHENPAFRRHRQSTPYFPAKAYEIRNPYEPIYLPAYRKPRQPEHLRSQERTEPIRTMQSQAGRRGQTPLPPTRKILGFPSSRLRRFTRSTLPNRLCRTYQTITSPTNETFFRNLVRPPDPRTLYLRSLPSQSLRHLLDMLRLNPLRRHPRRNIRSPHRPRAFRSHPSQVRQQVPRRHNQNTLRYFLYRTEKPTEELIHVYSLSYHYYDNQLRPEGHPRSIRRTQVFISLSP